MRKMLIFLLALVLLNGVTEIHQFLKLPLLLSHFRHHRTENPAITLFEFLRIHYHPGHHPDDQDEREDSQLPFKSSGTLQHTDIPLFPRKEFKLETPGLPISRVIAFHPEGDPCHRSYSIFHPPPAFRTCGEHLGS